MPLAKVVRMSRRPGQAGRPRDRLVASHLQLTLAARAPFQNHDAGVVLELAGLMLEDVPDKAPDRLRCGIAGRGGGADEVGQPLFAEELPLGERASVIPSV